METFKIRKYGNASAFLGAVSTNYAIMSFKDLKLMKFTSFVFIGFMTVMLTQVPQNI
jgi:hypothetical protein